MSETTYGLTPTGFVRMRLPEITAAILADFKGRTGLDLDPSPDSISGQLVATFAEREAALWELAEQAFLSAYPVTAEGLSLDLAVSYAGVSRLDPDSAFFREPDDALRARYRTGVHRLGAGTIPAIEANLLQDVPGILTARVYENTGDTPDADGRPPHSLEAVVEGGDDAVIAALIRRLKPAGIVAHGNSFWVVSDPTGREQTIWYSRPEPRLIWLRATLETYAEEAVPGNVAALAAEAMVLEGATLGVGQDVLLQRIAAAVFPATTGVARVRLQATSSIPGGPIGSFAVADIAIGPRERAAFHIDRVDVG